MAKKRRARPARAKSALRNQRELERIENLLGEDFESLSEARKALQSDTGIIPNKRSYTVKELSSRNNRTVRAFLTDLEGRSEEIDALKPTEDYWAANIYGKGTYQLYGSIEKLTAKLATYKGLQQEDPKEALKNVNIIHVRGVDAANYYSKKKAQVEKSWAKAKRKHKLDRTRQRKQTARLRYMEAQLKAERKKVSALRRQLAVKK